MANTPETQEQDNPYAAPSHAAGAPPDPSFAGYAGFWKRVGAALIDTLVLLPVSLILGFFVGLFYAGIAGPAASPATAELFGNIFGTILSWLYYALLESSGKQGTVGKMALGIAVTDLDGNRIGFGRATGRHFAKILSTVALFIGFIMVGLTEKKQGLHDMVAGCLVVNRN